MDHDGVGRSVDAAQVVESNELVFDNEMHAAILLPTHGVMLQTQGTILAVTGHVDLQVAET